MTQNPIDRIVDPTYDKSLLPAVVLAAGLSTRMGQFKPLMELGGEILLRRVVRSLLESHRVSEVIVVTGYRAAEVCGALHTLPGPIRQVENPQYAQGEMLSSVKTGMNALPAQAAGLVLAFADQPMVHPHTIERLIDEFLRTHAPLVLPVYRGRRGHPIVIRADLIQQIRQLPPGDTLRTVVHHHLNDARLVEVQDSGVVEDLDTPQDHARAQTQLNTD